MKKSQIAVFTLLSFWSTLAVAQVACPTANPITVTRTTGGAGVNGSLPWAITCLNNVTPLTTIQFNIAGAGPHIIRPITSAPFPTVTKANAHIDGSTDNIIIDGSLGQAQGLVISANSAEVNGLTLRNFATTNFSTGLALNTGNDHDISTCQIFDNLVGISVARSVGTFTISNNYIGVDKSGTNFSNTNTGIEVATYAGAAGPPTGTISNNFIAFGSGGVLVGTGRNVIISRNSIFCNSKMGIERSATLTIPTLTTATTTRVSGTAPAGATIEVFRSINTGCTNAPCQGKTYVGSVVTNAFGAWNLVVSSGLSANDLVTATSTLSNNTSEFSACRVVVDVCANFLASIKSNDVTCNGGNNGSATASASGGSGQGINFVWSTNATTATISNLSAGTYRVTATDNAGCQSIQSVNILQPTAINITPSITNVACNGERSGAINAAATGGVGPYTYRWSNGATTSSITSLAAGVYTLTVTDQNNCTKTASVTLTQPTAITLLLSGNDTLCAGAQNGTAIATVSGGVTPYAYSWSNGATTSSISNLGVGNYTVTVTDQNRCQKIATISVIATQPFHVDSTIVQPKCVGESSGSIAITLSGGTPPYTYLWENGATTNTRTGLPAGAYNVTVTDANRCSGSWAFTLRNPAPINAQVSTTEPACFGQNTGTATVTVIGSNGNHTYLWSTGATTSAISNLGAGRYNLTVTNANGCQATFPFTINAPSAGVDVTTQVTNVDCFGASTGQIQTSTTGGQAPYTYLWSNGLTNMNLSNLKAGTYALKVSDQAGCADTTTVIIRENPAITTSITSSNPACFGQTNGQASVSVSGGSPGYTYLWSNGATTSAITGLGAGKFVLTVTDARQCTKKDSAQLTAPSQLQVNATATNVTCNGTATGSAQATVSGGTAPYTYAWSNGATTSAISNLVANTYTVTVNDSRACQNTATVTVSQPAALVLTLTTVDIQCNQTNTGQATATASGGTSPYRYAWSNGATTSAISNLAPGDYGVTVTDAAGCQVNDTKRVGSSAQINPQITATNILCNGQNTGQASVSINGNGIHFYAWSNGATTSAINNLAAGNYSVTVTNSASCRESASTTITAPPALTLSITPTNLRCNGQNQGQAVATAGGGVAPYTYSWSNGATTSAITGLAAGNYSLTITDANRCTLTQNVNITAPALLQVNVTATNVTCNGTATGSAQATVSGGTAPYTYAWSTGATTSAISNLAANTYTVTVSDSQTCQATATVTVSQPAALVLTLTTADIQCNQTNTGQATATVSGGTTPYRYAWSNGATTSALSNLAPGDYSVTVTDAAGCQVNDSKRIGSAAQINPQITSTNILCNGQTNGQASVTVTGNGVHTYAWSNGATSSAINNLAAGAYSVTVTNSAGCKESVSTTITAPPALTLSITPTNLRCNGQNQGQALATAGGGVAPYAYRWSNGATTSAITGLAAGNYSLTITDANQCTRTQNTNLTEPAALQVNATFTRETSPGARNGTATATASGGTGPYRYNWNTGATTAGLTGLAPGVYTVTVTDANGCTGTRTGTVNGESCPSLGVSGIATDLTCAGSETGSISVTVVGGTLPYFYAWSNGQTSANLTDLNEGTYSVTVSDASGCTGTYTTTLRAGSRMPKPLYGIVAPDTVCGNETFTLRADDLFQGPGVKYVWQLPNGEEMTSTTPSLKLKGTSSAFSGEYSALRDSVGCRSSVFGPVIVDVISLPPNSFSAGRDTTICQGTSITLRAQAPTTGRATWFALSTRTTIQNPNSTNATAQNLNIGANRFVWRIALGRCIQAAADTVTVFLENAPKLADDRYTIERAQDVAAMNILLNDNLAGIQDTTITWSGAPAMGNFEFIPANKSFRYTAEADFRGVLRFTYTVCNEASRCASPCDSAGVTIEVFNLPKPTEGMVLEDPGPNGTLQIRGLQGFSSVDITITNRWGDVVYRNNNYDNNAPWRGRASDSGPFLPPGAYYYVVRAYDNGSLVGKPQTGAIYLFKKDQP